MPVLAQRSSAASGAPLAHAPSTRVDRRAPLGVATLPFFVVSSGRSGTKMMERLLGAQAGVEMHHEYLCTHVQPLAVRYTLGLVSAEETAAKLDALHGTAVRLSSAHLFGDSSSKLAWLVEPLRRVFPNARFVHLVRDGRKVCSSYFHKLADECYDDRSYAALLAWLDGRGELPPPEKRYWWNPAPAGYGRFQRIAHHWAETHRTLRRELGALDPTRVRTYRLEDLVANEQPVRELASFLGLDYDCSWSEALQRPHNVNTPVDRPLTPGQRAQLRSIAGDVMREFGYDREPEYAMRYDTTLPA